MDVYIYLFSAGAGLLNKHAGGACAGLFAKGKGYGRNLWLFTVMGESLKALVADEEYQWNSKIAAVHAFGVGIINWEVV